MSKHKPRCEPTARFAVHIDVEFAERVKNAAHATQTRSLAGFLQCAIVQATLDAEKELNAGQPFPPRPVLTVPRS